MSHSIHHLTSKIKTEAYRLGFDYCGVSKAEFLEKEAVRLEQWLQQGMHGKMKYMEAYFDKRLSPQLLVDNAKSVISLLFNYYPSVRQKEDSFLLSKYAYGKDYHYVIKEKLNALFFFIKEQTGDVNGRAFVDSAPVMERAWAEKSGLGWIGKNTHLITRQAGSFFFTAELIIDMEMEYDVPAQDFCGTCTRCMDTCPTNAIVKPYTVDGSRCISYLTIELREQIPEEMKGKYKNWIFGCDVCQDVCPWNRFAKPHHEKNFAPQEVLLNMKKKEWEEMTRETFRILFKDSAVKRSGYEGLKRNIAFVANTQ